jgi:hypothetical protein
MLIAYIVVAGIFMLLWINHMIKRAKEFNARMDRIRIMHERNMEEWNRIFNK